MIFFLPHACDEGITLFERIAPSGILEIPEWTALHALWLAVAETSHCGWLVGQGIIPRTNLERAYLRGAYLRGAYLERAYVGTQGQAPAGLAPDARGASRGGAAMIPRVSFLRHTRLHFPTERMFSDSKTRKPRRPKARSRSLGPRLDRTSSCRISWGPSVFHVKR